MRQPAARGRRDANQTRITIEAFRKWRQAGVSKYRNVKTVLDGQAFDSKKEARRWTELRLLEAHGKIHGLQRQVTFVFDVNGARIGSFKPDFVYLEPSGRYCAEDVKSRITRKETAYRLRVKLFRALYPAYDFRET